jgi:hypothetical protein
MSNPKKRRDEAKRKRELFRQRRQTALIDARITSLDIHAEISHITQLAQAEDARLVTVGNLVFFSTKTRDAWMLDREDNFAMCLCRDGEPQTFRIIDGPDTTAIEWAADFEIEDDAFVVKERSGRVIVIEGYPVVEIAAACRG